MLKNHSMLSTRAFLLDFFLQMAKLLAIAFSSDGQVPLKKFIMDISLHIPPETPPRARSVNRVNTALPEAHKPFLGCSFSNRVFSVEGTDVLNSLCSFGASTELVNKKVSEMFIVLNFTLHSFGPEHFVPLVVIEKFQKGLIEENESYEIVYDKNRTNLYANPIAPPSST
jgi:hypothetical protein